MTADALNLHASALVIGEAGVMIRGASGAGKTRLALALVREARRDGGFARIVADDRTLVRPHGDRVTARPHPRLAGRVERRGLGVGTAEHEPACVLRLVVDLVDGWPDRMPEPAARRCEIAGVAVARLAVPAAASTADAVALICAALDCTATMA